MKIIRARALLGITAAALAGCTEVISTAPATSEHGPQYTASAGSGPAVAPVGAGAAPLSATAVRLPWSANARSSLVLGSTAGALAQAPGAPTSPYLVWTNTSTGERVLWEMDAASYNGAQSSFGVGTTWQIVGTGDFSC